MSEQSSEINLEAVNQAIADRRSVFYWQTDRAVEPEQAGSIWADRHRYFTDKELVDAVGLEIGQEVKSIVPLDLEAQTNLGNVNSVRALTLKDDQQVIVRCHPKGIKNGYFHVEALAAQAAVDAGLPSFRTLGVHDLTGDNDFAFHVLEKLQGAAVKVWLEEHPEDEEKLLHRLGAMMAEVHKIKVDGFGPFDNEQAKEGKLTGIHSNVESAVNAGLQFNLEVLVEKQILTKQQADDVQALFTDNSLLKSVEQAVLVHNDFADWNVLTDGEEITGILDWDECVAGDPVSDIACWSTFFPPERLEKFLQGYWEIAEKPGDFEQKFELLRLRYVISKMTLRTRRYAWDPSEAIRERIESGTTHLQKSIAFFNL